MRTVGVDWPGNVVRRLTGAIMLALAPAMLAGGFETHLGHVAGGEKTPIFADARHAEQATHCEAAETIQLGRCVDCLAPAQPLTQPLPMRSGTTPAAIGSVTPHGLARRPDLAAAGSRRPRAPPSSALS
jgi:hypothetical protein